VIGLRLIVGLLVGAVSLSVPAVAVAQVVPAPAAMVEGAGGIDFWGFAAYVPVGGRLTWTNLGTQSHTVTALDGSFDSGTVAPGSAADIVFETPGLFTYTCALHPSMKGFVVVSPDATGAGPSVAMVEGNQTDVSSWGFALSVQAGQSVAWANIGAQPHTATATDGSFDTGIVAPGATGSLQFDAPGVFAYLCSPHPWMRSFVAVNPLAAESIP
jgi:plastocyanin